LRLIRVSILIVCIDFGINTRAPWQLVYRVN
jgi:hypothetical protein